MSSLRLQNIDLVPWRRCRAAIGRDLETLVSKWSFEYRNRDQKILPEHGIDLFHPSNFQSVVFLESAIRCSLMSERSIVCKNSKIFSLPELSKHPTVCGFWCFQPQANLACIVICHYVLHSNNRFHERTEGFSMVFLWVARAIKDEFKVKKVRKFDEKMPTGILQLASFVLQV